MQQTPNYQLDLIETDDPLSPAPLNGNAEKIEAALDAEAAERGAADAALEQRVAALELHKFVSGTYTGTGKDPQFIDLGFTPAAVLTNPPDYYHSLAFLCLAGAPTQVLEIVSGGFNARTHSSGSPHANAKGARYEYIALL